MKTKEELAALKKEVEALNAKLAELSEDELAQVSGGIMVRRREVPKEEDEQIIGGTNILSVTPSSKNLA